MFFIYFCQKKAMKRYFIFCLFFCLFFHSQAQVNEDFSDTNLFSYATWYGQTDSFTINKSLQLQLNALGAGTSYISTLSKLATDKNEWRFWIRLNFSGSDNNYAKFYIAANTQNLTDTSLQGYYLRFGESGNADAIRFYKQNGKQHQLLCSGKDSAIANSFAINVKVIYSDSGYWELYTSLDDGITYTLENTCRDTFSVEMSHLGLVCTYTKSNSNRFYFDDIYCDEVYVDKEPPSIDSIFVDEKHQRIFLQFNENIDSISGLKTSNYIFLPDTMYPDSIAFIGQTYHKLMLFYSKPFPENSNCSLHISNIFDLANNRIKDTLFTFFFYHSNIFDVVINEIMAKPTPEQGLPDVEYIELKNRTPFKINLNTWKLYLGKTIRYIENCELNPNQYIIVCAKKDSLLMATYGQVAVVSSMSITDGGQTIQLFDNQDKYIHSVEFTPTWHTNNKSQGGWALEMIDFDNPCSESDNWTSSTHKQGGTPGQINSVYTLNPDLEPPYLDHITTLNSDYIKVYFSEIMLAEKLGNLKSYKIDRNISVDSLVEMAPNMKSVGLKLNKKLEINTIYTLSIVDTLSDCAGNIIPLKSSIEFGYSQTPEPFDIIINEVLFNPRKPLGVDFVEVYNRSDKIIDLKDVRLSTLKNDKIDTGKHIAPEGFQLFPSTYALLSSNTVAVQNDYVYKSKSNFVEMNSFPTYSNKSGTVILLSDTLVLDYFDYTEDMHYPLLKSVEGVSLERINPDRKTQDASNWHSAASTVGYATPGYLNSSYSDNVDTKNRFHVYPEIFSPDQDGYNDLLNIAYQMEQAGYRASIQIYNSFGKKIKTLANNILLDTEGVITWDGTNDLHTKAATGVYIIVIDYFNLKGEVQKEKLSCTLAIKNK